MPTPFVQIRMSGQELSKSSPMSGVMTDNEKRNNAMLTKKEREFLKGDGSGVDRRTAHDHREQIKKRVRNTILDFQILFEHWPEEEREEVFREAIGDNELQDGLASFIALVYMENRFESGLESLIKQGVTKAEREMAESGLYFPTSVEVSINHIEQTDFEKIIENFGRSELSDMSDGEAQAVVRLLHRRSSAEELEEMRRDMVEQFEEFAREYNEAKGKRTDYTRKKQASHHEGADNE